MKGETSIRFSVLDRLIGAARRGSPKDDVDQYMDCVLRDLEDLFNTRRTSDSDDIDDEYLENSIYAFGIPDFATLNAASADSEAYLRSLVEEAIKRFEPRLSNVDVEVLGEIRAYLPREVKLLIRGHLTIEEDRHPVIFDTVLDVVNGELQVLPHGSANG
jgi:type VI secretion system protein ImpF